MMDENKAKGIIQSMTDQKLKELFSESPDELLQYFIAFSVNYGSFGSNWEHKKALEQIGIATGVV